MAFEYRLHDVGEGIDAGEVVEWHVAVGDEVKEDQPLLDIQTDKALVMIPCPTDGVVLELRWQVGDMVPVGEVLAVFGDRAELEQTRVGTAVEGGGAPTAGESLPEAEEPSTAASPAGAEPAAAGRDGADGRPDAEAQEPGQAAVAAASVVGRALASPAVRRLARERGVELGEVEGSGPGGRITREDVVAAAEGAAAPAAAAPAPAAPPPRRETEVVPLRGTRRVIARNLTRSWQEIPHIIDFREADASNLIAARKTLRAKAEADADSELAGALTPLPLLAKIAATVALRHPRVNSSVDMEREEITLHGAVNLSIAISAPDGLVTPTVRDADRKPVPAIAREIAALAAAARARRLTREQLSGGTLTVNNYGSLGSPLSTPIIPPGQAVNLGIGRMSEKPVVRDGEIVIRPILGLSCSGDHRVLDGNDLTSFVNDVVAAIEDPLLLLGELA
jgi:pyruvate dehydrogenase E2 component (dihydrolipoamide acetyltransferase)